MGVCEGEFGVFVCGGSGSGAKCVDYQGCGRDVIESSKVGKWAFQSRSKQVCIKVEVQREGGDREASKWASQCMAV